MKLKSVVQVLRGALQFHFNTQSHWSSGSTICFPSRGSVVRVPGMHILQWNWVSPVSAVSLQAKQNKVLRLLFIEKAFFGTKLGERKVSIPSKRVKVWHYSTSTWRVMFSLLMQKRQAYFRYQLIGFPPSVSCRGRSVIRISRIFFNFFCLKRLNSFFCHLKY